MADIIVLPVAPPRTPTAGEQSIRERIDARQYPLGPHSRPIVPLRCGAFATITSTTLEGERCIGGVLGDDDHPTAWRANGRWYAEDADGREHDSMLDIMVPGYVAEEAS